MGKIFDKIKNKINEMANDPYKELHEERLKLKDKKGNLLYEKKGNDIVPRNDGGYVYPLHDRTKK